MDEGYLPSVIPPAIALHLGSCLMPITKPNPYRPQVPIEEPLTVRPQRRAIGASRKFAVATALMWIALPLWVLAAQQISGRIFADFAVQLPAITGWLLYEQAALIFASATVLVVMGIVATSEGRRRTIFVRLGFWAGVFLSLGILAAFLLPLLELWYRLT